MSFDDDCCHLMLHFLITQDTPCVLLHKLPGGELQEVATGKIVQPIGSGVPHQLNG